MRYRSKSDGNDLSRDLETFVDFVGETEYRDLLASIGRGLNQKGYVTESDDLRFSLELELVNLEFLRIRTSGRLPGAPQKFHEAVEFVCGLGQTIPHLSSPAQAKLRGQIVGGLKTSGLRPLQHEMRVAGTISRLGFDISFSDLEGEGGYDFLAERSDVAYEIEAKCLSGYTGHPIPPQDADKFFLELRQGFDGWNEQEKIPVLNIVTKGRLSSERGYLRAVVDGCNTAATMRTCVKVDDDVTVEFHGAVIDAPYANLKQAARIDSVKSGNNVYVCDGRHKVIARLRSEQPSRFAKKLIATISDASRRQFSGTRPAAVWAHVDYMSTRAFEYLAHSEDRNSVFDAVASAVFRSSKREHIMQLAFSGGAHPVISDGKLFSSFKRVVYDAPRAQSDSPVLLPGGKRRIGTMAGPGAKTPISLFRVIDTPPPTQVPIADYDDLLARLASAFESPAGGLIAATLVDKANALASLGRTDEAIAACDEALTRYGSTADPTLQEAVASALIVKGVALGHSSSAIQVYDEILDRFGTMPSEPMRDKLATALFNKGNALGAIPDRANDAVAAYNEVIARFGDATDVSTRGLVARSLYNKGRTLCEVGREDEGIGSYKDVVVQFGRSHDVLLQRIVVQSLVNISHVCSDPQAALLACDDALSRLHGVSEPDLLEQVAKALVNKGSILLRTGREAEALTAFGDLLLQFSGIPHAQLQGLLATALLGTGRALHSLGRNQEAITAYDAMLRRLQDATEPALRAQVAMALAEKAIDLLELGEFEKVIETCDEFLSRFSGAAELDVQRTLCVALRRKQRALEALERYDDVISACDQLDSLVAAWVRTEHPQLRGEIAAAYTSKANALGKLGRMDEEIESYQALLECFGSDGDQTVRELVMWGLTRQAAAFRAAGRLEDAAQAFDNAFVLCHVDDQKSIQERAQDAMIAKAAMFVECGRHEDAIATVDAIVGSSGRTFEQQPDDWIAAALVEKGQALAGIGKNSEAVAAYDVALGVLIRSTDSLKRISGVRALLGKGLALKNANRLGEAVVAFDEVDDRCGLNPDNLLREYVAVALLNKADVLAATGRPADAVVACDALLTRLSMPTEEPLIELLVRSLVAKGDYLADDNRPDAAIRVYDVVVEKFSSGSNVYIQEQIATATYNKGVLLGEQRRHEEALDAFDAVITRSPSPSDVKIWDTVARALINKTSTLADLDRSGEAIRACNDLLRFIDSEHGNNAHSAELKAYALMNKADVLIKLGDRQEALAALDDVLARAEAYDEPRMADLIAEARTRREALLLADEKAQAASNVSERSASGLQ
jgi:tetratricopeptide (TPR) repeat protein